MKNQFENDPLLKDLKSASMDKQAPILYEEILVSATHKADTSRASIRKLTGKPVTWLTGLGSIAAVIGLAFSVPTTQNANPEFRPFQLAKSPIFNLAEPPAEDSQFSRVWVPEVVAKLGTDLSTSHDGWGPIYEAVSPSSSEEYAKFLATYFEVQGELTEEKGYSASDSHSEVTFYQIYDSSKKVRVTVSPGKNGGIGFSVSFPATTKGRNTPTPQEAKNRMQTLLQDLVVSQSRQIGPGFRPIEVTDVRVKEKSNFVSAEANLVVAGKEIDLGFLATFTDGGQLRDLYGTLVQFEYKGIVDIVSEVDAVSRLGAYWDNPYRVKSIENSAIMASTQHCENNPTLAMKCETTVDKAVRGISATADRDGKVWLVPSYSMYHNGHFIGAVNAMSLEYLNISG